MKKIIFLVGPSGIGKTKTALDLAKTINVEIVSCDSMQVYREMNIISDKPALRERRRIIHHLVGELSIKKNFSVADYQKRALQAIRAIHDKGKIPLVVGGSGMYIRVLLDGIFSEDKKKDNSIRNSLYKEAKRFSSSGLYKRLKRIDPRSAAKIHPNDLRRIVRALEVYKLTGEPISDLQSKRQGGLWDKYDCKVLGLNCERNKLYQRIDSRVEKMFKRGLAKEIKSLLRKHPAKTAASAIGIKEVKGYLDQQYDLNEAKRLMKRNSRRFAKRQLTWFRKEKRISWVNIKDSVSPDSISKRLIKLLGHVQ